MVTVDLEPASDASVTPDCSRNANPTNVNTHRYSLPLSIVSVLVTHVPEPFKGSSYRPYKSYSTHRALRPPAEKRAITSTRLHPAAGRELELVQRLEYALGYSILGRSKRLQGALGTFALQQTSWITVEPPT